MLSREEPFFIERRLCLRPPLRRPVCIPDSGYDAQHKTSGHPPGRGVKEVCVTHPAQPSSDNQRSEQIGCDPDRLAEPGVQWIL